MKKILFLICLMSIAIGCTKDDLIDSNETVSKTSFLGNSHQTANFNFVFEEEPLIDEFFKLRLDLLAGVQKSNYDFTDFNIEKVSKEDLTSMYSKDLDALKINIQQTDEVFKQIIDVYDLNEENYAAFIKELRSYFKHSYTSEVNGKMPPCHLTCMNEFTSCEHTASIDFLAGGALASGGGYQIGVSIGASIGTLGGPIGSVGGGWLGGTFGAFLGATYSAWQYTLSSSYCDQQLDECFQECSSSIDDHPFGDGGK